MTVSRPPVRDQAAAPANGTPPDPMSGLVAGRRGRTTYRLSASVRLPWLAGLVVFLAVAVGTASLVGRTPTAGAGIPRAVTDPQAAVANAVAQGTRRSLNEGVADLTALASVPVLDRQGSPARLRQALARFAAVYGRYSAVGLERADGTLVAAVGPDRAALGSVEPTEAGIRIVRRGGDVRILEFAPSAAAGLSAVAEYDPGYLDYALDAASPASAWIVDPNNLIVAGPNREAAGAVTLVKAPLRAAADRAFRGETGSMAVRDGGDTEIVSYAPVAGPGPAGSVGWVVVTERRAESLALPQFDVRRQAVLAGLVIGLAAALVFGWLYLVVFQPLFRLQSEAERIAFGDLRRPVEVIRYDEIGFVARALERVRVLLIRDRGRRGS